MGSTVGGWALLLVTAGRVCNVGGSATHSVDVGRNDSPEIHNGLTLLCEIR
jgi:hypothetical protein